MRKSDNEAKDCKTKMDDLGFSFLLCLVEAENNSQSSNLQGYRKIMNTVP
jgi:hypothetical protein